MGTEGQAWAINRPSLEPGGLGESSGGRAVSIESGVGGCCPQGNAVIQPYDNVAGCPSRALGL